MSANSEMSPKRGGRHNHLTPQLLEVGDLRHVARHRGTHFMITSNVQVHAQVLHSDHAHRVRIHGRVSWTIRPYYASSDRIVCILWSLMGN